MIFRPIIFLTAASILSFAAEPTVVQPTSNVPIPTALPTGQAWLGLQLAKAEPTMSAHIPALPPGIGFVVKTIDPAGPGEVAKLQALDVLWKLNDQMLINEGQLATLLRLCKPGDQVALSLFRGGQLLEVKMKLGDLPVGKSSFTNELVETAIFPNESGPMRVVNVAERTATYSTDEGKAVLRREGDAYLVVIKNPKDELIFEGDVSQKEGFSTVPDAWRRRVWALRRGLDHALEGNMVPVRPPRPRVVPAPAPDLSGPAPGQ